MAQVLDVPFRHDAENGSDHFPPITSRINALGATDNANLVDVHQLLEHRHADDGFACQPAQIEKEKATKTAFLGCLKHGVEPIAFSLGAGNRFVGELKFRSDGE